MAVVFVQWLGRGRWRVQVVVVAVAVMLLVLRKCAACVSGRKWSILDLEDQE